MFAFEMGAGEATDPIASVASYLLTRDLIGRMRAVNTCQLALS